MLYIEIHHIYTNTQQRSAYYILTNCLFAPCQLYTKVTDLVLCCITLLDCGPCSVVGIATCCRLDSPGIKPRWGQDFLHLSRPAVGPTQPPVQWVPCLSRGVKSGQGVTLTPHPLLVPRSTKSRVIPLLPLWAIRPVQSFSAYTRVHFTFTFLLCLIPLRWSLAV